MATQMKKFPFPPHEQEKSTLLTVSASSDDLRFLNELLSDDKWIVRSVRSCSEAFNVIKSENPAVVACEHDLGDGSWKDLLNLSAQLEDPPPMVVFSQHADERLWAEVLHLGGYDVLAKPFEPNEVARVLAMASRHGRAAMSAAH